MVALVGTTIVILLILNHMVKDDYMELICPKCMGISWIRTSKNPTCPICKYEFKNKKGKKR